MLRPTGIPKHFVRANTDIEAVKQHLDTYATQKSGRDLIPAGLYLNFMDTTSDEIFPLTKSHLYPETLCVIVSGGTWGQSSKYLVWVVKRFLDKIDLVIDQDQSIISCATEVLRRLEQELYDDEPHCIKDDGRASGDIYPDEAWESLLNEIRMGLRQCTKRYRSNLQFWQRVQESTRLILRLATELEQIFKTDPGAEDETVKSRQTSIKKELSFLIEQYNSLE